MSDAVWKILSEFGETDQTNVWKVQNATVIKHACLERVAAKAGVAFDTPQVLRAERDEAVILVTGRRGDRAEWSIGEARTVAMIDTGKKNNYGKPIYEPAEGSIGNYQVTPKQAAYPYAMAEKRAKDRVILKLINLHGLAYSEDEADDFKEAPAPRETTAPPKQQPATQRGMPEQVMADDPPPNVAALLHAIGLQETSEELYAWGVENKPAIDRLPTATADKVRAAYHARRGELGKAAA